MEKELNYDEVKYLINKNRFQEAKTMKNIPHSYSVRKNWNDNDFCKVVMYIRKYGYREKFGSVYYTYLDIDGYKYWTMGAPINETIILNKAVSIKKEIIEETKKSNVIGLENILF